MAIDPLKVDNPVVPSSSAAKKFPLKFPAKAQIDLYQLSTPVGVIAGAIIIAGGITYIVFLTSAISSSAIQICSRPLGILFAISVMCRWNSKSEASFLSTSLFAVLALIFTTPVTFHYANYQTTRIASVLAMTAILWSAVEIAIHYRSIDAELMRRDPEAAQARLEKDENAFQVLAIVFVVAICFALWADSRLFALPVVATFGLMIAYARAVKVAKFPLEFLKLLIPRYFAYPDGASLAPGLIVSAASPPMLRTIPMIIVILSMPLLSAGIANLEVALCVAVGLILNGLYASLSLQLLGASFSARPAHFDENRTPFDVITSRLRDLED